jgi:hypothetical protein
MSISDSIQTIDDLVYVKEIIHTLLFKKWKELFKYFIPYLNPLNSGVYSITLSQSKLSTFKRPLRSLESPKSKKDGNVYLYL